MDNRHTCMEVTRTIHAHMCAFQTRQNACFGHKVNITACCWSMVADTVNWNLASNNLANDLGPSFVYFRETLLIFTINGIIR